MKIVAFNGSPRGEAGNTDRILQPFLTGAWEAGAVTETVYLKDKKVNHCLGCPTMTCWVETPGVCVQKDDMAELLRKFRQADIIVYATPLHYFTVSGLMKDFMDRQLPLLEPYSVKRGNMYTHGPRHKEAWPKKVVLISNCAFPERHHFTALVETFQRVGDCVSEFELAAVILCAAGETFRFPIGAEITEKLQQYVDAARNAGREIVDEGRIRPETQALLDSNLIDPEIYAQEVHQFFNNVTGRQLAATQQTGERR